MNTFTSSNYKQSSGSMKSLSGLAEANQREAKQPAEGKKGKKRQTTSKMCVFPGKSDMV